MDIQGTVRDILKGKGDEVWTTRVEATVYEAIRLMGEQNIGALVVVDDGRKVVGVLSERDYSRKVALQGRTSRDTKVGDILSGSPVTVTTGESVAGCMQRMTEGRFRHLPVIEDERLIGLVSMGDLVRWVMESQQSTIEHLQGYISGSYPG